MSPSRTFRRGVLAALAATVVMALPAAAHPFIADGGLPVDSLATMRLSMAHGCGGDDGGEEQPTTEVALEVPDWLRVVEVPEADGYRAELETAAEGSVTTVVWTVEGDGIPAPAFDLEVVASGEPGETRHLAVFQACGDDSYRWVGTPGEPADDPAISVTLTEADPDAPPPPVESPVGADTAEPVEPDEPTTSEPTEEPSADATGDPATEDPATGVSEEAAADAPADDGGSPPLVLFGGLVVVALAAVAVLVARRRRGGGGA